MIEPSTTRTDRPSAESASYDPTFFARLASIEDRHFWFRARNRVISTIVRQITATLPPGYRVLDAGCGTGNVLRVLPWACPRGRVMGMDLFAEGLHYARRRTASPVIQADVHHAPFRAPFQVIGLFDVLEHLEDDVAVLGHLHGMLAPGGALVMTVPAHQSLWSFFDEASHHCRRYAVTELERKLVRAGFRVTYLTQFMASIFPLVWAKRRLAPLIERRPRLDAKQSHHLAETELSITPVLNEVLSLVLTQEARVVARRLRLPVGTSLLAVAYKIANAPG